MTAANFSACLAVILQHEGGYVNNSADPGGATNLGITVHTLSNWLGRPAVDGEVRMLTAEAVAPIYRAWYWNAESCDDLPTGVDLCVFDDAVNTGPGSAAKRLQKAVGAVCDGAIGPRTLASVKAAPVADLIETLAIERENFYRSLPTFATFGHGWLNRVEQTTSTAHKMARS